MTSDDRASLESAEAYYRSLVTANDMDAAAHNNLGWVLEQRQDFAEASRLYRTALAIDSDLTQARVNLASLLSKAGDPLSACALWDRLLEQQTFDKDLLEEAVGTALRAGLLSQASRWALAYAVYTRGSPGFRHPEQREAISKRDLTAPMITTASLSEAIQQMTYLKGQGHTAHDLDLMIDAYRKVELSHQSSGGQRRELTATEQNLIGDSFGRLWNVQDCDASLADEPWGLWDPERVEQDYKDSSIGICVIDDFLNAETLEEIRKFCLGSTVWFANHYAHGRHGAFFREGFNNALLIEIARLLPNMLPHIIGAKRLLQLWGFKYQPVQPKTHAHADFASVNVNFWITREEANLDPRSGGLVVFHAEAPKDWTHDDYNKNGSQIETYLNRVRPKATYIPYRANRAVIFNSDLFHGTAPSTFSEEYSHRRVNITMLYGRREDA